MPRRRHAVRVLGEEPRPLLGREWEGSLHRATRLAWRIPSVVGVDYGCVYKNGFPTGQIGVRFHVKRKIAPKQLPASDLLPKRFEKIRCDVLESNYSLQANAHGVCDPIEPGISIGNLSQMRTGTLGMIVVDGVAQGQAGILSNWHVLAGSAASAIGDPISQPGPLDLGTTPARVVARLTRWLSLNTGCDAAFAAFESEINYSQQLFGQNLTIGGVEEPALHMKVVKSGITTGLTHGKIDGIGGSYNIDYSAYGAGNLAMDAIHVVPDPKAPDQDITLDGDSGAVWFNPLTSKAVALHFAGESGSSPMAEYSLAQPLPRVLSLLNVGLK